MAFTEQQRVAAAGCVAQMFALRTWSPGTELEDDIIQLFNTFLMLIGGSAYQLVLSPGKVYEQGGSPGTGQDAIITPGGVVQLNDNQYFPLVVQAVDTKGFPVSDTSAVSFTSSDETILTIGALPDPANPAGGDVPCAIAGNPGSAVLTGTDGSISGTLAVDVTPGGVAALTITAGQVADQPAPPAP
jgi:hypothetical protein